MQEHPSLLPKCHTKRIDQLGLQRITNQLKSTVVLIRFVYMYLPLFFLIESRSSADDLHYLY